MFLLKDISVLFIVLVALDIARAFISTTKCVAPRPCTCEAYSLYHIHCQNANLTVMPTFTKYTESDWAIRIYLYNNRLTTIPANAFKNLSSVNVTDVWIVLFNNRLHCIDSESFSGLENTLTSLDLGSNSLTSLPVALLRLSRLKYLNFDRNPLVTLDATIVSKVGLTLQSFYISVDHLPVFPNELHYLRNLTSLAIHTNSAGTNLDHIPQIVTRLPHLKYLDFGGHRFNCSCTEMSYLKSWNITVVDTHAMCSTGIEVKTFLMTGLPKCP